MGLRPVADVMRLNLAKAGYGVHVERDGASGLAAIRALRPAAVIYIGLPGLDGIEVCRRLRSENDWTPVLFVTARDDEVDRIVGLELGADDYVTKPFSPRDVDLPVAQRARHLLKIADSGGRRTTTRSQSPGELISTTSPGGRTPT